MSVQHTPAPRKPQHFAQKVKAGRGWLIVRNSATIAETDYEARADEIVAALNGQAQRDELAAALRMSSSAISGFLNQCSASEKRDSFGEFVKAAKAARAALAKVKS